LLVARVETRGDQPVFGIVLGQTGVEKEERDAPDPRDANQEPHGPAAEVEHDDGRSSVRGLRKTDGQLVRIEFRVLLSLPPVGVEQLSEISFAIEEADAHERQLQVARGLQDVARENPEAARVDRKRFGQSELRRKISDSISAGGQAADSRVERLRGVLERELRGEAVERLQK